MELCAGGVQDVQVAEACGLQRIELNNGMALGGLTPSAGLVAQARKMFSATIIAMLRPREGGFCYSEAEFQQMMNDAQYLIDNGCDGLAVGFLNQDGTIDATRCARLRDRFPNVTLVFHRAFDVVPDFEAALETLVSLRYDRILTSGGKPNAVDGLDVIRTCRIQSNGRIEILPGSGIRAHNVRQIIDDTGCQQVHTSVRAIQHDPSISSNTSIHFGGDSSLPPGSYGAACPVALADLMKCLKAVGE